AAGVRAGLDLEARRGWRPPVLETRACQDAGTEALAAALDEHASWLETSGTLSAKRRRTDESRVRDLVQTALVSSAFAAPDIAACLEAGLDDIARGASPPYRVAARILDSCRGREEGRVSTTKE